MCRETGRENANVKVGEFLVKALMKISQSENRMTGRVCIEMRRKGEKYFPLHPCSFKREEKGMGARERERVKMGWDGRMWSF
jgi:hypothetical protein